MVIARPAAGWVTMLPSAAVSMKDSTGVPRLVGGGARAALQLDGVEPERRRVALRLFQIQARGDEEERLRGREGELVALPLRAHGDLLAPHAVGGFDGRQLRRDTLGVGAEVGRQGQFFAGLDVEPALVGDEHAPHRLANRLVIVEIEQGQRLRRQGDFQAVRAVLRHGIVHDAFEPIEIAAPALEAVGEAAPVRARRIRSCCWEGNSSRPSVAICGNHCWPTSDSASTTSSSQSVPVLRNQNCSRLAAAGRSSLA